ncbi:MULTISPECIES: sugar ABC transporter ATP-binding protein [unclassified Oceanispirochaeta]|uniref:sugar ABC transporter ATP-binding protein n=1 Tax=unclassified Oceanispirochaeta TaxID=2635722 RepID=UPI000E09AD58|nr:sugar ABC transporter ATP-binding protein [Oceanispirochaeta sp. M1]MBF9014571.1 sugar ABC transporter ATP-binding protein [Oceanispirochaeta sp. M2]NPD70827.1 sugar ABC transporter ATP-binding protein [Oceanispirochaeta sp. M1]RDG34109.1 sugar ABC transporter ATP-binding protein [Oceanispirochaeta sp. M1]
MAEYSLEMKGIRKQFPGVLALDDADFSLKKGEVHALLGINGAGKSTLIKVLSGIYRKDQGSILINGKSVEINDTVSSKNHGVATVYQDPQMIPSFTAYENIFLGNESEGKGLFPVINRRKLRQKAGALLKKFPVNLDLNIPVSSLEAVERESVAILRALSQENMHILILDEPTSILTQKEISVLFEQIKLLQKQGISIIYITHRLDEVFKIADSFTVFRNGKDVGSYQTSDAGMDHAKIAELMLGDKLEKIYPDKSKNIAELVLKVEDLTLSGAYQNVSFEARKGEVLGVFGLVGSGIDELSKSLFGVLPPTSGLIEKNHKKIKLKSAVDGLKNGIYLIPGDRRQEGQIGDESVSFNMTLSNLKKTSTAALVNHKKEIADSRELIDKLDVRPKDSTKKVSLLSGGNQQKVVIAKGLYTDSDIYIFCEPTVGVDVGAKASIYQVIRDLSVDHCVLVIGSDCEEVLGICDRAIVLYKGQMVLNKAAHDVKLDEMLLYGLTGGDNNE